MRRLPQAGHLSNLERVRRKRRKPLLPAMKASRQSDFFSANIIIREQLCVKLFRFNFKLLKLALCKKPPQFPEAVYT
ncbi:hypothetical protein EXN68_06380 [Rhizobium rhizogenes]|uniref:Uncharacterized protein n=1 Tax=Rhizobium rhizogenes TaxID=359 RepID=A0A546XK57_RHIRH|nr:hypothetical protein EXN68_06380 [Rhizobium rhizogenes]